MSIKKVWAIILSVVIVLGCVISGLFMLNSSTKAAEISIDEAESYVNRALDEIAISRPAKLIAEMNRIKVNDLSYGEEKNIILKCSVETIDVHSPVSKEYDRFLGTDIKKKNGTMFKSALDFKMEFEGVLSEIISSAQMQTIDSDITLYDTKQGLKVYLPDEVIDCVYGGIIKINQDVKDKTTYKDLSGNEQKIMSGNVNKGFLQCFELRYDSAKPDTSNWLGRTYNSLKKDFIRNFIEYDRWVTIFQGLWVTIKLTFFSLIIGIVIGFIVAFVRCTYIKNTKRGILLKLFNSIFQVYLTVIRGTPAMVQIMIIYFVIFMPLGVDKFVAAVVCFGLNSGAYVAEIVRGGIMSIDDGQQEAGRSLGFGYMPTMFYIVFPQAFKAVLPALANEFVVLLKETSIAFYIGLGDLMYSVNAIRAATYTQFMPLIAAALIYLVMVLVLSKFVGILERRLRNNER